MLLIHDLHFAIYLFSANLRHMFDPEHHSHLNEHSWKNLNNNNKANLNCFIELQFKFSQHKISQS